MFLPWWMRNGKLPIRTKVVKGIWRSNGWSANIVVAIVIFTDEGKVSHAKTFGDRNLHGKVKVKYRTRILSLPATRTCNAMCVLAVNL
jgi:hypothetical protein